MKSRSRSLSKTRRPQVLTLATSRETRAAHFGSRFFEARNHKLETILPIAAVFSGIALSAVRGHSLYHRRTLRGPRTQRPVLPPVIGPPAAAPILFPVEHISIRRTEIMAKRCAFLVAGLALVVSSTGCCCGYLHGYNRCNPCGPCGAGYPAAPYGGSPCGPGGCSPSYYPPVGSTSYYQGFGASAYLGEPTISTASPTMIPGTTYPTTAQAPTSSLPTY